MLPHNIVSITKSNETRLLKLTSGGSSDKSIEDGNQCIDFEEDEAPSSSMTASYTEIPFDAQVTDNDSCLITGTSDFEKHCDMFTDRPNKLMLNVERAINGIKYGKTANKAGGIFDQLNGTVTQEGEMVSFVAEDLEKKIKLSSPLGNREESTLLETAGPSVYRPLVLPFHSSILNDLEIEVSHIATSVDTLTENLAGILHSISALTVDCLEIYRDVVCKTCDAVDLNIKSTYQLMAKCEELSKSMKPVYKFSEHVKEIKHFLDLIEGIAN